MLHLSSSENKEIFTKLIFWSPLHFLGSLEALQLKDMKGHSSDSERRYCFVCVLVLAGTELTLFLVAGTVLCFGFSVRMMLITL